MKILTHLGLYLIGSGLCVLVSGCFSDTTPEASSTPIVKVDENKSVYQIYEVSVNNLRLRKTPDLSGVVFTRLREGSKLEFYGDSTNFTTAVKMNGITYDKPWFKVKTKNGREGWVHTSAIRFIADIDPSTLKNPSHAQAREALLKQEQEEKDPIQHDLLVKYKEKIGSLSTTDLAASSKAYQWFETLFESSNATTCDRAFVLYLDFLQKILEKQNEVFRPSKYGVLYEDLTRYGSPNMEYDAYTKQLKANGLAFGTSEGSLYLRLDWSFVAQKFYRYTSTEMRTYLDLKLEEYRTPWAEDAALLVAPEVLAQRTLAWDHLLMEYPNFIFKQDSYEMYKRYVHAILFGLDNTPVFNPQKALTAEYKEVYEQLRKEGGHTRIGNVIQVYWKVLEKQQFVQNEAVRQEAEQLYKRLIS